MAAFTATETTEVATIAPTADWLVTVDETPPAVTLTAPATTAEVQPLLTVTASDLNGLAVPATATILVYNSTGTTLLDSNSSAATLTDGQATFRLGYTLTVGTTYLLKAQVNDRAGNTGTSAGQSVQVTSSSWSWATQALTSDPLYGDALDQLGDVQLSHALDLGQSSDMVEIDASASASADATDAEAELDVSIDPLPSPSTSASLIYNSDSVSQRPVIQATLASANNAALPSTITAVLTWNGTATTFTYSTSGDAPGDPLTIAAQGPLRRDHHRPLPLEAGSHRRRTARPDRHRGHLRRRRGRQPLRRRMDLRPDRPAGQHPGRLGEQPAGGDAARYGTGGWAFYPGTTTFTSPADDPRAHPLGRRLHLHRAGRHDRGVQRLRPGDAGGDADGQETLQFRYGGGQLTGVTTIDGGLSTFSYSGGLLSTIQSVNGRTCTMAYSGEPDGGHGPRRRGGVVHLRREPSA